MVREVRPRKNGRWLVMLENGTSLQVGEDEILSFSLRKGRNLDETETAALMQSLRRNSWKEKIKTLLIRQPKSRKELEQKLQGWGASPDEIHAICDQMEQIGLLNDREYAERVIRYYTQRGYGTQRLRQELYRRGIPRELWDEVMTEESVALATAAAIDAFFLKKFQGEQPDPEQIKKISATLARRGYSWEQIHAGLRRYQEK